MRRASTKLGPHRGSWESTEARDARERVEGAVFEVFAGGQSVGTFGTSSEAGKAWQAAFKAGDYSACVKRVA